MKQATKSRESLDYYLNGILNGDRIVLAKAITLVESTLASDQELATQLMEKALQQAGKSIRIGITGSPGVGKSTFIEVFGKFLTELGKKVAVLSIDPSSQLSKGSILGDKTRMTELSTNPNAFIRPSSSGDAVGGVGHKTREAMLLCEAAGYDTILIETMGVGQSEVVVKNMTDFFLLLMLPGSGDELQGIKKGIMEMADLVVITKADGENLSKARQSQADFQHAINVLHQTLSGWMPKVLTVSSVAEQGMREIFEAIAEFIVRQSETGEFDKKRAAQNVSYMHAYFDLLLKEHINQSAKLQTEFRHLEDAVLKQQISPNAAAKQLLHLFFNEVRGDTSTK